MANHIRKSKKAKGHGQKPKRGRPKTKKTGGKSKGGQKLSKIDLQQAKIKKNLNKHQISNNRCGEKIFCCLNFLPNFTNKMIKSLSNCMKLNVLKS